MRFKVLIGILLVAVFAANLMAASQDLTAEGKKNLRSANMHASGKRFEKALPMYDSVLKENPNHVEALNKYASILFDIEGNFKEADLYFQRIINQIDEIITEYETLKTTDEKAAKKFYKKVIKKQNLEKMKTNSIKLRASCWAKMFIEAQNEADFNLSLEKFEYIYSIAPDSIQTVKMLAYTNSQLGNDKEMTNYLIVAAEMDPTDDINRTKIGNYYFGIKDYENAATWYNAAIAVNSENVDNFYNVALVYGQLKNEEAAAANFEKVVELDPENGFAYANLSNYYSKNGEFEKSLEYLKKTVDLDPKNVDYVAIYCSKLLQDKRYEAYLPYAEKWKALSTDPKEIQQIEQLINFAKKQIK